MGRPEFELRFCAFGVRIGVTSNAEIDIERFRMELPANFPGFVEDFGEPEHRFSLVRKHTGDRLYRDGEVVGAQVNTEDLLPSMISLARLAVAEFAPDLVFVHAGVVASGGRALILPGRSMSGKSTLVRALVERGVEYYSDEYAVFDTDGLIRPYPKPLSLRPDPGSREQTDVQVRSIGGTVGQSFVPVGWVVDTKYRPNGVWRPKRVSRGSGIIALLKNTIPVRRNPGLALEVLGAATAGTAFIRSSRGDAGAAADRILEMVRSGRDY